MVNRRSFMARGATAAAATVVMASATAEAVQEQTVGLNVVYPNHAGAKFDVAYYRATHIPLAMKVMKADKVLLIEGVSMDASPPPFAMIAHLQFASAEALKAALADPAMADVRADVARFTDIKPTIMFGKS